MRGEKPRDRTFKRKTDAELWAKKVESDLDHGFYVPTTADRRRTLGELIDKFLTEPIQFGGTRPVSGFSIDAEGVTGIHFRLSLI